MDISLLFLCLVSLALADDDRYPEVVDMSHRLKVNETLYYPSYPEGFQLEKVWASNNVLKHGVWVEANRFSMIIHTGTHMDAPCHFCNTCWRMHQVPFENLRGPAAVFDIVDKVNKNTQYELTVQDILDWERENGAIPKGAMIMLNTGGQVRWPDWHLYWGSDPQDSSTFEFPGLSMEAVEYLLENVDFKGIGMDWGIIDSSKSELATDKDYYFHAHRKLLSRNKLLFEYVKNIQVLPPTGYTIYVNPLNIYDSCGAPVRMIAVKNPESSGNRLAATLSVLVMVIVALVMV